MSLFTSRTWEQADSVPLHTNTKWVPHLEKLTACGLLLEWPRTRLRGYAKYFAVPKGEDTARAIVNLRGLSQRMKPPATTNLPEIETVLKLISSTDSPPHILTADFRHFFHQFRVLETISEFFGIVCGSKSFRWTCLPMGWSYSPKVAQTAGWVVLLEAAFRAKLAEPEDFKDLQNTPMYANIKNGHMLVGTTTFWRCLRAVTVATCSNSASSRFAKRPNST